MNCKKMLKFRTLRRFLDSNMVKSMTMSNLYGHLMIMADQDHDGSHIKGLLINFLHSFWPSLLKVIEFVIEFITPIVKATQKNSNNVISFYNMPEYEAWKESLGCRVKNFKIKYYKVLMVKKELSILLIWISIRRILFWADDEDGEAIELAFSKKKIEARKTWLRAL
ncbi:hypothetical protein Lser_V15G29667 [Lactuca serriola]